MRLPFGPRRSIAVRLPSNWLPRVVPLAIVAAVATAALDNAVAARQPPDAHQDSVIGQWRLDVSKSTFTPGPGPKSETRTYQVTADGIRAVIVRTRADGRVETIEYDADYDSVNHVIGTPDYDAVRLKRINAYVSEATLSHAGKLFGTARREIAKDGLTMVITFQQDSQTHIHNVAHYVKVTP
jgi:hypothetical protein